RLEQERAQLRTQIEKLGERERSVAEREREAAATIARTRERMEAERSELREAGARVIDELRREGAGVIAEMKTQSKTRHDLAHSLAAAGARLEAIAPRAQPHWEAPDRPLRAGDQVELGDIRGELLAIEPGKATFSRGGLRIEVAPERLRRARPSRAAAVPPAVTVTSARPASAELNLVGERTSDGL